MQRKESVPLDEKLPQFKIVSQEAVMNLKYNKYHKSQKMYVSTSYQEGGRTAKGRFRMEKIAQILTFVCGCKHLIIQIMIPRAIAFLGIAKCK